MNQRFRSIAESAKYSFKLFVGENDFKVLNLIVLTTGSLSEVEERSHKRLTQTIETFLSLISLWHLKWDSSILRIGYCR